MLLVRDTFDLLFFFFNDTATTEIYTLSLHDALPISAYRSWAHPAARGPDEPKDNQRARKWPLPWRKTRLREETLCDCRAPNDRTQSGRKGLSLRERPSTRSRARSLGWHIEDRGW